MHAWGIWRRRSRRGYAVNLFTAAAVAVVAAAPGLGYAASSHQTSQPSASPPACSARTDVPTKSGPVCGVTAAGVD